MVRLALVGCGRWGRRYLETLSYLAHLQLVAVVDTDPQTLASIRTSHPQVVTFSRLEDCLARAAADAFIVATPASTHYALAAAILGAAKHLLLEKPVAERVEQARELVELAQQHQVVFMAGHLLEYQPATVLARCYRQRLGSPQYVRAVRCARPPAGTRHVLHDLLVHDLARMRYLLEGQPEQVLALGSPRQAVSVILRYPQERWVQLTASWIEPEPRRQLELFWPQRMLLIDDLAHQALCWVRCRDDQVVKTYLATPGNALQQQCEHFVTAIGSGVMPRTGAADIIWVTTALSLAQESLASSNRWVSWPQA